MELVDKFDVIDWCHSALQNEAISTSFIVPLSIEISISLDSVLGFQVKVMI